MQVFNREQDERRVSKQIQKHCGWRNVTRISERKAMCPEPTKENGDLVLTDTAEVVRGQIKYPHGLQPTRLLCPGDSPDKNTGVGSHSLLQGIFPTHGSNPNIWHYRQTLYHLSHKGSLSKIIGLCFYSQSSGKLLKGLNLESILFRFVL